jgi:hypothetical protein
VPQQLANLDASATPQVNEDTLSLAPAFSASLSCRRRRPYQRAGLRPPIHAAVAAYGDKRVVSTDSTFNVISTRTACQRQSSTTTAGQLPCSRCQPECADDIAEVLQVFDTHVNELKLAGGPALHDR